MKAGTVRKIYQVIVDTVREEILPINEGFVAVQNPIFQPDTPIIPQYIPIKRGMLQMLQYMGSEVRVFEQHVTLDFSSKRIDDESAIEANRFTSFTEETNLISQMSGPSKFDLKEEEKKYVPSRKQMVAARDLPNGAILTERDIQFKRT
ncbi:MAG: hypothetical protein ACQEXQ_16475 [Bacillota bacterium]